VAQRRHCKSRELYFICGKSNENNHRIVSAGKRADFVSDRMSYVVPRGRWFYIIISNTHAPNEVKGDDKKDSFYEDLEQAL
jgi:hypothetical protein